MGILIELRDYAGDGKLHAHILFYATLALLSFGLFLLLKKEFSIHSPTKLPIAGIESPGYLGILKARFKFVSNGFNIVRDAYHKYPGRNFVVTTYGCDKIILTHAQVKELASAPEDVVSIQHASAETMMIECTGLGRFLGTGYAEEVVRVKLTQNLANLKAGILEETRFALDTELPGCSTDEWRSVEIFTTILRVVARTSSRAFVGLPLCRNEDWLTVSIMFTRDVFMTLGKLTHVPKPIRPLFAYIFNSIGEIRSHKEKAQALLDPIFQSRLEEERLAEKNGTVYQKPNDMLQWLTDRVDPPYKSVESLSELQLLIILSSIHTMSLALLNTIFDLAEHQECVQQIREEIEAVLSANNGVLDSAALRKMKKTDSFLKEALRARIGLFSFNRMVMKSLTLSDGTYLPKGVVIAAPTSMFSTDPDFVEDPEKFDGFRWYKKSLEAEGGVLHSNNFTTTSPNDLTFGHGKHACPGRFFAAEEMKIILVFLLFRYDFKYPEGQSRPRNLNHGEFSYPDTTKHLLFKKSTGPMKFPFLQ
ncbi:unnamed protein product [Tuber aestivum]|uniref:Cytochrome P450 n=1 Tax=Tuber aestivum TaxID=59557 RepID=A0A292PZY4_9PEZI|nr:unnamed protein product [Tuber aestivum]